MLDRWSQFVQEVDPDIITGYNIQNFDIPYIVERAAHLKRVYFPFLGRIQNKRSLIRTATFASKQMGKRGEQVLQRRGTRRL